MPWTTWVSAFLDSIHTIRFTLEGKLYACVRQKVQFCFACVVESIQRENEWEAGRVHPILSLGRNQSALGEGREDTTAASTISSHSTQNKLLFKKAPISVLFPHFKTNSDT